MRWLEKYGSRICVERAGIWAREVLGVRRFRDEPIVNAVGVVKMAAMPIEEVGRVGGGLVEREGGDAFGPGVDGVEVVGIGSLGRIGEAPGSTEEEMRGSVLRTNSEEW